MKRLHVVLIVLAIWSVLSVVLLNNILWERDASSVGQRTQQGSTAAIWGTSQWRQNTLRPTSAEIAIAQTFLNGGVEDGMQGYLSKTFAAHQLNCYAGSDGIMPIRLEKLLKALKDYSWQHTQDKDSRVLVWMCTTVDWCGGLADRLKGITYSLLLSLFTRRKLLLTWNTAEQKLLGHNALNWSTKARNLQEYGLPLSLYSITQGYGIDKEPSLAKKIMEYINGPHKVIYFSTNLEPSALINKNKSFGMQWISRGLQSVGLADYTGKELDTLVGLVFRYLFVLDKQLITKLRAVKQYLDMERIQYVGVHVRTGFAGTIHEERSDHPKLLRLRHQWEAVLDCAVTMADRHLGNDSLIFLASDSLLVKQMASLKYARRMKSQDILLGHLDSLSKNPIGDTGGEEVESSIVEGMWTDLLLLAESSLLVITDSGFGALAGLLCGLPPNRTVHGLTCTYT